MDIKKINLNETMTSFSGVGCTRLELFVHLLGGGDGLQSPPGGVKTQI